MSIPIRPFNPNPPPKNQGLIGELSLQKFPTGELWGNYMACIYEVQELLDLFFKNEKKWRLGENFHGFIYADAVGICKILVFGWVEFKSKNK